MTPPARPNLLPRRSPWLFHHFRNYVRKYVASRFHAVRLARDGFQIGPGDGLAGPLLVVVSHPSWWDPMIGLILGEAWTDRIHFAPIDVASLAKYRILERLGFFGVLPASSQGAREFLRRGAAILAEPNAVLWVTAQGKFVDPRARPIRLKEGVGHLLHRASTGHVLTLALEYPFWNERNPEALARFSQPIPMNSPDRPNTPAAWTALLEQTLESNQNALAAASITRNPALFTTTQSGASGAGGLYDLARRLKSTLLRRPYTPEHGSVP